MKKWVLIADADEQFRNELVTALAGNEEFEVMGIVADGEEALQMLQTKQADYLVMDLLLPKIDGLTVLEHVRGMWNRPKVLISSAFISKAFMWLRELTQKRKLLGSVWKQICTL